MKKIFQISKKIIISILILSLLSLPVPPNISGQETEIQKAVQYLKTQPADPWTTMALLAGGETGLDLEHLKTVSGNLATDYEKTILALTAAGKDPRTFGNIDFIAQLKSFEQSNQIGSPSLLNDDFWGILALVSAGESPSDLIIQNSKNFILTNQNSDGGWSYAISGQSDTNDTAIAIAALLETGMTATSTEIVKAIDYLKSNQNNDGGFPYHLGGVSDSGSDAWIISLIYRLGQNPTDWQKVSTSTNPIDHMRTLQRADGSFKWIASEDTGYPVLTTYAVIALTQNYYPVNRLHHLRIEGKENQICGAYIKANTALDIVENGAVVCGYAYSIATSSWGLYLKKINNEEAQGGIGWLYFVNYQMPWVGASAYTLGPGDEVLWYFGDWGWKPTRLTLSKQQVNPGDSLGAKVEYFENSLWKPLDGATIYVAGQTFLTNNNGEANLSVNKTGSYPVWAKKSGYIRTNQIALLVGQGVSQDIGLKVEIIPPSSPQLAFSVSKSQLDFGRLIPGAQASDQFSIQNNGNVQIFIEGIVSGDQIFQENLKMDNLNWPDFTAVINTGSSKNVSIGLTVPSNWTSFGIKGGNLTLWATPK